MKIYHTKTQEDFDALMNELEEEGVVWAWSEGTEMTEKPEKWGDYGSRTCVRVVGNTAFYDKKGYYTGAYSNVPIIKYKAGEEEE